ncbi:MAG: ATP-binding protein [Candidatus Xenobiia bacterium LiM19]
MLLPEGFRFKLIFLFILQGTAVFLLSFTHHYTVVGITLVLLAIVFSLWMSRDLTIILSRKPEKDPLLEDDMEPSIAKIKQHKGKTLKPLDCPKCKEAEAERKYITEIYKVLSAKSESQAKQLEIQKILLEEEKNKIEVILKSVPDGVVTINREGTLLSWNPGAEKITGWRNSEISNVPYHRLIKLFDKAGNSLAKDGSPIDECFRSKQVVDSSGIFLRTRSQRDIPIDMIVTPVFDEKKCVVIVVAAFRDISKKWEIEKLKEDFLAMVTHDLKSPLAAIHGYTNLLLHPKARFSVEESQNFLNSILGSVNILKFLIDNILESARLESGRIVYQFEDFELSTLMIEIETMFTPLVNSKRIKLDRKGDSVWVYGDREKLREVINNLISNAIKFTPEDGRITLSHIRQSSGVEIRVQDTGKGIPSEELSKLFKKFVQVKGEKRGTGLGLYIVKRIIEDHGEKIDVKSVFGKGTEFIFTLKSGTPKEIKVAAPVKATRGKKGKVLIVEDNMEVSNLIRYYLRQAGYDTKQVFQGGDVPALVEREKPDLITLDYDLPDINGEDVIKSMKKENKGSHIPIIIVTANSKRTWDIEYESLLSKPLDEVRFLAEVDRVLSQRYTATDSVEVLK